MPGFRSELSKEFDYLSLPDRIDEESLERRVIALRLGDMSQAQPITIQLMRLVMSLVANFAHPRRTPDLIGVALLTLVESVNDAPEKLVDNNIIPYVSANINWRLKDFIDNDHVFRVPSSTLRALKRKGVEVQLHLRSGLSYDAIARPEAPSLELREMLQKIVHNDREKMVLQMRSEGHVLETIAESLGVSVSLIHKMKSELRERFMELTKEGNDARI